MGESGHCQLYHALSKTQVLSLVDINFDYGGMSGNNSRLTPSRRIDFV